MTKETELTLEYLRSILSYDPETGMFVWLAKTGYKVRIGAVAGCLCSTHGYCLIKINKRQFRAHRLAWFYMTGKWPSKDIDHKDRNKLNNKFNNLREATVPQNGMNKKGWYSDDAKGTYYSKSNKGWVAQITANKVFQYLGTFQTQKEANTVYREAAKKLHGEFCYNFQEQN